MLKVIFVVRFIQNHFESSNEVIDFQSYTKNEFNKVNITGKSSKSLNFFNNSYYQDQYKILNFI